MDDAADEYLEDETKVKTFFGCMMGKQPVSRIARRIVSGSLPQAFRGSDRSK